jgi:hypothetical protein
MIMQQLIWFNINEKQPEDFKFLVSYRYGVAEAILWEEQFYLPYDYFHENPLPKVTHWTYLPKRIEE